MLSAVIRWESSYPALPTVSTTGTPGIPSSQSSRTRDESPQISTVVLDRDRAVLRRSEPSSRTALTGEQPDPWELLHPQDAMSRHREFWFSIKFALSELHTLVLPQGLTIPSSFQSRKELVFYGDYKFCFIQTKNHHPVRFWGRTKSIRDRQTAISLGIDQKVFNFLVSTDFN